MNEESLLVAKLQDVTTKNCSVINYQGADSRKLPSGSDKLQQREYSNRKKLAISKKLSIK